MPGLRGAGSTMGRETTISRHRKTENAECGNRISQPHCGSCGCVGWCRRVSLRLTLHVEGRDSPAPGIHDSHINHKHYIINTGEGT